MLGDTCREYYVTVKMEYYFIGKKHFPSVKYDEQIGECQNFNKLYTQVSQNPTSKRNRVMVVVSYKYL